jgi:nitronate monooxygenase
VFLPSELPIVGAPMAGGPSTPQLTAAVCDAGGFGYTAGGYLRADALAEAIRAVRALTGAPFGVNLFVPSAPADPAPIAEYARLLEPEAGRLGVPLGQPRWDDDGYAEKLDLVLGARVHTVSFAFGCPDIADVERAHRAGAAVAVTVTSAVEALHAYGCGADLLVVQGSEAGGHQSSFLSQEPNATGLLALLGEIRDTTPLPLIGAGAVMTGPQLAAVLAGGAVAAQLGTALLCAAEAGTSTVHRKALLERRYRDTMLTRAFTGRYARGLANRFAVAHSAAAPAGYPQIHHLTRPLRVAATAAGDPDVPNLWAGTGWPAIRAEPAATIIARIAAAADHAR